MIVELLKEDLVNLVKGCPPSYHVMGDLKKHGTCSGGFKEEWKWNYKFEETLTEQELWSIYKLCKESWKNE